MITTGLVRVTVAAPRRRIDVALPERSPLAEMVPGLLRHAGVADDGTQWLLRRFDGTPLDVTRSLGAHRIRDGEVLHLVERTAQWPELEYDDVVDVIADGAGRAGRQWEPRHTRQAGLVTGALAVLLALVLLRADAPLLLVLALVLVVAGTSLARAFGDAGAGAVVAALALPCAFSGGTLLMGGSAIGAPHVLAGSAVLLFTSVLGYLGVVDRAALFVAAATVGLCGVLGGWLAQVLPTEGVAAIGAGAALVFSPLFTTLSIRLSRVPMPVLPRTPADLVRDDPQPPRAVVYAAVLRADALLTGLLCGTAVTVVVCEVLLVRHGTVEAMALLAVLSPGFLLRARLYPAIRHRVPLLVAGLAAAACVVLGLAGHVLVVVVLVVVALGALAVAAGLTYSSRPVNAYLGRIAELLELLVVLACVPVVCAVLDLYSVLRGLGG